MREEGGEKRINFLPSKYHACGYLIFLLRESLRVTGREEGGRRDERERRKEGRWRRGGVWKKEKGGSGVEEDGGEE